jgi:DNA mismatch repair protein MutS2
MFFIDELGQRQRPQPRRRFCRSDHGRIIAQTFAYGIVTTHYLNLKVMANHTQGIINGAMQFDEVNFSRCTNW